MLCERKRCGHGLQPQRLELIDDGEQRQKGDRGLFLISSSLGKSMPQGSASSERIQTAQHGLTGA